MSSNSPLELIRNELVTEALASPVLLSDLAGLEAYVGETYAARALVELIQNAEDAGGTRVIARLNRQSLLVANDGRRFTDDDFRALCRSAASTKRRGESIGYRGIGFKSVVTLGNQVLLLSGPFEALFSREMTKTLLPTVERVPLIRIPHPIPNAIRDVIANDLESLHADGFGTVFLFESPSTSAVIGEFRDFSASAMLFLRNIGSIELISEDGERKFSSSRATNVNGRETVTLLTDGQTTQWELVIGAGVSLAFRTDTLSISDTRQECVVHAFLPTDELTGFGVKINGDFDTDPSRTRVVFTDRTSTLIDAAAELLAALLRESLSREAGSRPSAILSALAPTTDPRLAVLGKRSFARELLSKLKVHTTGFARQYRVRPPFLNQKDYELLATNAGHKTIRSADDNVEPLTQLMRFLGVPELSLDETWTAIHGVQLSTNGCVEILSKVVLRHSAGESMPSDIEKWSTWVTDKGVATIAVARERGLDQGFLDAIAERVGSRTVMNNFLTKLQLAERIAESPPTAGRNADAPPDCSPQKAWRHTKPDDAPMVTKGLTKWRTGETNAKEYFESLGYSVIDVSRQNLGYDLEARNTTGEALFIEVKSIDMPGQPFSMTSNEEAAARVRRENYLLVLVHQSANNVQIAVIEDPVSRLEFSRQCRQWVWECARYPFVPIRLAFPA